MTAALAADFNVMPTLANLFAAVRQAVAAADADLDLVAAHFDRVLEKRWPEIEDGAKQLLEATADLRARAEAGEAVDLDALIESIERDEAEGKAMFEETDKLLRRVEKRLRRSPRRAAVLRPRLVQARELCIASLELYQDVKWQLMAIRSRVEQTRDSPTFDNAKDLRRYLESRAD